MVSLHSAEIMECAIDTMEGLVHTIFETVPTIIADEVHDPLYLGLEANVRRMHAIPLSIDICTDHSIMFAIQEYADEHGIGAAAIVCELIWDNTKESALVVCAEDRNGEHEVFMSPIFVRSDGRGTRYLGEAERVDRDFGWRLFGGLVN